MFCLFLSKKVYIVKSFSIFSKLFLPLSTTKVKFIISTAKYLICEGWFWYIIMNKYFKQFSKFQIISILFTNLYFCQHYKNSSPKSKLPHLLWLILLITFILIKFLFGHFTNIYITCRIWQGKFIIIIYHSILIFSFNVKV